jgi:hypothetical protein
MKILYLSLFLAALLACLGAAIADVSPPGDGPVASPQSTETQLRKL